MITLENLILILWKPFVEQISTNFPVFFTFHRQFIIDLFKDEGITCIDPIELINSFANKYILINGDRASLTPETFIPVVHGFSPVLILACQQILAVEDMVRDQHGHSDQAYFPRLRKVISKDLHNAALNPFPFDEFEKIWKTLATEMKSIPGYKESTTLTFNFNARRGINKARSFPLSQALLSKEDLMRICTTVGLATIQKSNNDSLWKNIQKIRSTLSKRASKLLLPFLRERILEQLISFSKKINNYQLISNDNKIKGINWNLIVFKDAVDWFADDDTFRAYLSDSDTNATENDELLIIKYINESLDTKKRLFLPLSVTQDYWVRYKSEIEITNGTTFLLICDHSELKNAELILKRYIPNFSLSQSKKHPIFIHNKDILLIEIINNYDINLFIYDGSLMDKPDTSQSDAYFWEGGVCINKQLNLYFSDFLPTTITFNGKQFHISEFVEINSKNIDFEFFKKEIKNLSEDTLFYFEFPSNNKARIRVASSKPTIKCSYGFNKLLGDHWSPVSNSIEDRVPALCGYQPINIPNTSTLPIHLLVLVINFLLARINMKGFDLLERDKVKKIVINSCPTKELKIIVEKLFIDDVYLSSDLIYQIKHYF